MDGLPAAEGAASDLWEPGTSGAGVPEAGRVLFHTTHDLDADGPLLVLTHGVGGHADLWRPFLAELTRSRQDSGHSPLPTVAVDLLGHGRSPRAPGGDHSIAVQAAAVGAVVDHVVAGHFGANHPVVHLGHSMGGMVGLVDAAQRPAVRAVLCCSTKYQWSERELAGLLRQAAKPVRTHPDEDEARQRHLTLTGLTGILAADSPLLAPGVQSCDAGWQVTQDPGSYDIGVPDTPAWRRAADAPVHWAVGSRDPLVPLSSVTDLHPYVLEGVGHNPHLESPGALAHWVLGVLDQLDVR